MQNKNIKADIIQKVNNISIAQQKMLGFPGNRKHAFDIDNNLLGYAKDSVSSIFTNHVGTPYDQDEFSSEHIKELEANLINCLATHFNLPIENSFGYVTTGGTEGNFSSIWWHRKYLNTCFKKMPIIVTSSKAHYSVFKIADQLRLKCIIITALEDGTVPIEELKKKLKNNKHPIIYVSVCGATTDGTVDNLIEVYDFLSNYYKNTFKIHMDGAIYGILIPYMKQFKNINSIFDYVDTVSFSGHKFLGSLRVCGTIITKLDYLNKVFESASNQVSILAEKADVTQTGSRDGLLSAELFLLVTEALKLSSNGKTQLYNLYNTCLERARWLYEQTLLIKDINKDLINYNDGLVINLPYPLKKETKDFINKKYNLVPIEDKQFGLCIFEKATKELLTEFLSDYIK